MDLTKLSLLPNRILKQIAVAGTEDCWEWIGSTKDGYGISRLHGKRIHVHRFIFELVNGPIEKYPSVVIRHSCDNRKCVNPAHLMAGTILDNVADRQVRNRQACGEKSGRSKLTESQVNTIRLRYIPRKVTLSQLGQEYGVTLDQIHRIITRKSWRR